MKYCTALRSLLLFLLLSFAGSVAGQMLTPHLKSVFPSLGQGAMEIKWDPIAGAEDYEYRVKEDGGAYTPWMSVGLGTTVNEQMLDEGKTYTYQVRVKIGGAWSPPSNERSNGFTKQWPVRKVGNVSALSVELLHGFGQPIEAGGNKYFHEGVDIQVRGGNHTVPK